MTDSKSQPTGGSGGTAALEARIERIRQSLAAQQARIARGSMLTASIGAILCVLMAFYFYVGYSKIKEAITPKSIVETAESLVIDNLPAAVKALEEQINERADEWAADISTRIQGNIPDVRAKAEDFIVKKADEGLDQLHVLTEEQFRTFLGENKNMMSEGFVSLQKPDQAEEFVQNLHDAVAKQMSNDIRDQSEEMLHTAIDLNAKLEKLKSGQKLNEEQALEREILMIAKRLQREEAELPVRTKKPSNARFVEGEPEPEANAAKPDADAEKKQEKPAKEPARPSKKPAEGEKSSDKEKKSGDS